jgi:hypothetical protein
MKQFTRMALSADAQALNETLRKQGLHRALSEVGRVRLTTACVGYSRLSVSQSLLALYESSSFHPSEMLGEVLSLLGTTRSPPVLSNVKLPLKSKEEYLEALRKSGLTTAFKSGVSALDEVRRAGQHVGRGEALALVKERTSTFSAARRLQSKSRRLGAHVQAVPAEPALVKQATSPPSPSLTSVHEDEVPLLEATAAAAQVEEAQAALEETQAGEAALLASEEAAAAEEEAAA